MTQRMIGAHSDVYTKSESWILLHPLMAQRTDALNMSYSQDVYTKALTEFNQSTANGAELYRETLSNAYRHLYENILKNESKSTFLDKTPRYYYIIDEILEYFPESKVMILIRNPLAVLNSIINTWASDGLFKLSNYRDDLLKAPDFLINQLENPKTLTIHFEELLKKPADQMRRISTHLSIPYQEEMVVYGKNKSKTVGKYGDKTKVDESPQPIEKNANDWQTKLESPQIWRLSKEYLEAIGEQKINQLGYNYKELQLVLGNTEPDKKLLKGTYSLEQLLDDQRDALIQLNWHKQHLKYKNTQFSDTQKKFYEYKHLAEANQRTIDSQKAKIQKQQERIEELESPILKRILRRK